MSEWRDVLDELQHGTSSVPHDDIWYYLTAAGLTEQSLAEAAEAVTLVSSYVPGLAGHRVADLGCGVGRHLAALTERCAEVVGIESSPALAGLASRIAPRAKVEVASFHDLAEFGAFDVVCAFSHSLLLTDAAAGVVGNLQLLRGAMPDYGLLIVEVMPVEHATLHWTGPGGIGIREERVSTPTGLVHRFDVTSGDGQWSAELASARVPADGWAALAEAGGFQLEAVEPFVYADGTTATFYFLRAQKGFNFLSDLAEFLESWADPHHPRNRRDVDWAEPDMSERVRPVGALALGQGASLSKHHPDFAVSLEPRIRPLVLELSGSWNYVTYSSCGGHLVDEGTPEVFAEAYCGVVVFSNRQISTITRLVTTAATGMESAFVTVEVRVRPLHGTATTLTAVDVLFRRGDGHAAWANYSTAVERAISELCERLIELRERS